MLFNKSQSKSRQRLHIKKGDKVTVCAGQHKSDQPREVLKVLAETGRVIVQGVNLRWKHQRRSAENPKGGRVQIEMPISASNVLLYSEKLGKGTRTRMQRTDGKCVRIGVKCGTRFD